MMFQQEPLHWRRLLEFKKVIDRKSILKVYHISNDLILSVLEIDQGMNSNTNRYIIKLEVLLSLSNNEYGSVLLYNSIVV